MVSRGPVFPVAVCPLSRRVLVVQDQEIPPHNCSVVVAGAVTTLDQQAFEGSVEEVAILISHNLAFSRLEQVSSDSPQFHAFG